MNKKIIAIAIATAMAAPVAMADVKVSGMMGGHLTMSPVEAQAGADTTKSSREFGDKGIARMQFDGSTGNAFARIAYNDANQGRDKMRDAYLGYNMGSSSISFGTMAGAAKNLEKDPYIATFLQTRGTAAEAATATNYGSSGFVNSIVQYATKAGGMAVKVQYDPSENATTSPNPGHLGLSVAGKSGAINYWVSYNTGMASLGGVASNHVNGKVGASMKMGTIKLTLNVSDAAFGPGANKSTSTALTANFALGGGLSADVGYAANGDTGTWMRAAVSKELAKGASLYGGLVTTTAVGGSGVSVIGAGMTVKF